MKKSKKELKRLAKIDKLVQINKIKTAKERHDRSRIGKLKKLIRRVLTGTKVFKFIKEKIVPVLLIGFAAAAYKIYGIPIPKEKKRKNKK